MDLGCARAIQRKKNLYAAGVISVEGEFGSMDAVELIYGSESIARGLTNYSSQVREAVLFACFITLFMIMDALCKIHVRC